MRETNCRNCGAEFGIGDRGTDCPGCHLCFDCAWPDCAVCGDPEGVRLNAAEGKVKPVGLGAVTWFVSAGTRG